MYVACSLCLYSWKWYESQYQEHMHLVITGVEIIFWPNSSVQTEEVN